MFLSKIAVAARAGQPVLVLKLLQNWSMEVMCRFAYGFDGGHKLAPHMDYMFRFYYKAIPWAGIFQYWKYFTFLPSVKKARLAHDTIKLTINHMIEKKKKCGVSPTDVDLLSELLRSNHHSDVIDDVVIADNCFQMITAGDTSPSALNSTFYLLAKHPHVQDKLREEIMKNIKDDNFTINNISSCHYLKMCIKESLRILPPVATPTPRKCLEPEMQVEF
eukprot:TRINITY_DN5300_c0_g1_i10.p1 TRINITY_DN5300_c0_g1~~TRINITY_DN5300_c0_g1_i10.p1  ORF type:complete len:219 (+),score=34.03 TRINITY_DN5300_c0_g1_i10:1227-1883(+)